MVISKTQPMRSAEIELVDAVNEQDTTLSAHQQSLDDLAEGLASESQNRIAGDAAIDAVIGIGFTPQNTIANSLSATNSQVLELTNGVDSIEQTELPNIQAFLNRFRIGATEQITVESAGSYSSSLVYQTPFDETDLTFVTLGFADDIPLTDLHVSLIDSTYSGFSYSVSNTGSDDADIRIGFLAVKVN